MENFLNSPWEGKLASQSLSMCAEALEPDARPLLGASSSSPQLRPSMWPARFASRVRFSVQRGLFLPPCSQASGKIHCQACSPCVLGSVLSFFAWSMCTDGSGRVPCPHGAPAPPTTEGWLGTPVLSELCLPSVSYGLVAAWKIRVLWKIV